MAEVLDHFIDAVDSGYLSPAEFRHHEHACKKALTGSAAETKTERIGLTLAPLATPLAPKHRYAPVRTLRTVRTIICCEEPS